MPRSLVCGQVINRRAGVLLLHRTALVWNRATIFGSDIGSPKRIHGPPGGSAAPSNGLRCAPLHSASRPVLTDSYWAQRGASSPTQRDATPCPDLANQRRRSATAVCSFCCGNRVSRQASTGSIGSTARLQPIVTSALANRFMGEKIARSCVPRISSAPSQYLGNATLSLITHGGVRCAQNYNRCAMHNARPRRRR